MVLFGRRLSFHINSEEKKAIGAGCHKHLWQSLLVNLCPQKNHIVLLSKSVRPEVSGGQKLTR